MNADKVGESLLWKAGPERAEERCVRRCVAMSSWSDPANGLVHSVQFLARTPIP